MNSLYCFLSKKELMMLGITTLIVIGLISNGVRAFYAPVLNNPIFYTKIAKK